MNRHEFEIVYGSRGGFDQIDIMIKRLCTLQQIAEHFGVSRERVRQWSVEIFGKKYDPRTMRRKMRKEVYQNNKTK